MNGALLILLIMHEEEERRRREEEEERKRKEKKRKEEENRKMINHRKNSPVVCNDEQWQINRCVKAISMQSCVNDLVSLIETTKPTVIENEEKKYDEKILEAGYEYELSKKELDSDIDSLKESGISIEGSQYILSRLVPINTLVAKIEQTTESFGNTFIVKNGEPIELNPEILSNEDYYENKYKEMNQDKIDQEIKDNNSKIDKYQRYGKYLGFLLKTKKYLKLEEKSENLSVKHEQCELRKREMQSFQSLNKDQLLVIKSYFIHLDKLHKNSDKIKSMFKEKATLRNEDNENIYNLTIKNIISNNQYSELVSEVSDYISKIYANDEETMKQAYELVKGEYPISISRRFIFDLIISNMRNYNKEEGKQLKK